jgi:hypothetical protein
LLQLQRIFDQKLLIVLSGIHEEISGKQILQK